MAALVAAGAASAASADAGAPATTTTLMVATVHAPGAPSSSNFYRLKPVVTPANATFRINDPASMLRSGYGGALVDLFPFAGGKFHISAGPRMFGRPGRWRTIEPETLRLLPAFRPGGPRMSRKFTPSMLVGYGRTVDRGLAFGVDAGFTMGRMGLSSTDRLGRLNRSRLTSLDARERRSGINQLMRVTALYRF
ncbi:hypothetical protein [Sphingomonas sp.]|uniref:hypothetical protein n=1 Tax=Sphingomonas sp. TaxID=28214 RepID=UPI003CC57400